MTILHLSLSDIPLEKANIFRSGLDAKWRKRLLKIIGQPKLSTCGLNNLGKKFSRFSWQPAVRGAILAGRHRRPRQFRNTWPEMQ